MISIYDKMENCCGCTACKSICPQNAIKMKPDTEGFLYPLINQELCIDCGICIETCAFQKGYDISQNYKIPEVYALKHKSSIVRKSSSSGGAFTAISDYILSIGGIIYGATFDENIRVIHKRANTVEGRNSFRGSKYVQSDLSNVFEQVKTDLLEEKPVLFTGTGCQVAGLKKYLLKSKVNIEKLFLVDFICHGTSSPLIFKDYISLLEKKHRSKVIQYYFRSKVNGWGHTEEVIFMNGKHDYTSTLSKIHKKLFYSNLCIRPSCHVCRYANKTRPSDITMADFWGIENYFPEFKDFLGVSAIIVNSYKGSKIFANITKSIDYKLSNIEACAKKQRNLNKPTIVNPRREEFWYDYNKYGFIYNAKKYAGYSYKGRFKELIKKILF